VTQLEFTTTRAGQSQNAKLRDYLLARPNVWLPMPTLADAIDAYAVHSRIADLRKSGMTISHKSEGQSPRKSFYRYEPSTKEKAA
jgi:hypothetical protein